MSTPEARIADRMRDAREGVGLSQEGAAQALGIALRTYARWERQESFGYLMRLAEIAKAFDTTESELLGGETSAPMPSRETLSAKLDQLLEGVAQIREDLNAVKQRPRR